MSTISNFFKNLLYISSDEEDDESEINQEENEKVEEYSSENHSRSLSSGQNDPSSQKKRKHPGYPSRTPNTEVLQIDCINIPKEDSDAIHLAKLTIDKLQSGHPVIASASEVIRDGKYYHMIFGACYALECKIEKITPYSFLILPKNFNVNTLNKKELASHMPAKASFLDDVPSF